MASNSFKQLLNLSPQKHRLLFNVMSITLLFPGVLLFLNLKVDFIFLSTQIKTFVGFGIAAIGGVVVLIALKNYDLLEFLGLGAAKSNDKLRINSLNKFVRHPLYSGTFLVVWGLFIGKSTFAFLVIAVVTSLYIFIGTNLEEKKLIEHFGDDYLKYKQAVPMFFPFKF